MGHRLLDVTARTTLDHVESRLHGDDWAEDALAVLDVESPGDDGVVRLGLEHDPGTVDQLSAHVDQALLTPDQARTLADALESIADAADDGKRVTSGRR